MLVTKKPSPEIIMSVARPVACAEPWVKLVEMPATWTPRPIWAGLVPPALGLRARRRPGSSGDRVSWNWVEEP